MTIDGHISEDEPIEPEARVDALDTGSTADRTKTIQDGQAPGSDVSEQMLREDRSNPESWLQYNKGLEQTGFTPASAITPENVSNLSEEYVVNTDTSGLQTNPLIVPSDPPVAYFTQTNQIVRAVNARTGEQYWQFEYADATVGQNRGVAVWQDKVYFGANNVHMIALDRYTGEQQWETSFLLDDPEYSQESDRVYSSQAPVAYDGKIFIGQSSDAAGWTALLAIDAESGDIVWSQKTSPETEWPGETWKFASSAAWMSPTVDPESDTVLFSIGNPNPMHNGVVRPGPNKFSNTVLALDAQSGDVKWDHQILAHELWDYDVSDVLALINVEVDGEQRRAVLMDYKGAWSYLIDVETGQLIHRSEPWSTQLHQFGANPSGFLNFPPAGQENAGLILPPRSGASEWPTNGFNPNTGLRYIGFNDWTPNGLYYNPDWEWQEGDIDGQGGGETNISDLYDNSEVGVKALDIASGEVQWKWTADDIDQSWASPNTYFPGGTVGTGGNLVFHGTPGGHLVGLNATSGEELWRVDTGGRITATPIVWEDPASDTGRVTIAANDRVITYGL